MRNIRFVLQLLLVVFLMYAGAFIGTQMSARPAAVHGHQALMLFGSPVSIFDGSIFMGMWVWTSSTSGGWV